MPRVPVLVEVQALPGAEREAPSATGSSGCSSEDRARVGAMSSGPSVSCTKPGRVGREAREQGLQVAAYVGSAFSQRMSEALVCCGNTVQMPS